MNKTNGILRFFQSICRFNFGNFEKEEFKKFLRMGAIFALMIGVYWTLRPLKDAIFIQLVDKLQLPFAKTVSVLALFWAFATDTTHAAAAKKGFPLVVAIGQIGGIILPYGIGGLPHRLGLSTDALSMFCLGGVTLLIVPMVRYFLRVTPDILLTAFHGKNEAAEENKQEPGFLEGLKLLLKNRYLLGIFAANFIYEVVVTIFDFNFKIAASSVYSGVALSNYLSIYGSSVNVVSLFCLLLGISNVTRFLGVGVALAAMPLIVGGALVGFLSMSSLTFLFALMVGSKAINYALNGPALKQLYIPTTPDVKFKAQAWIETFGSRSSKQAGSLFNMSLAPLQTVFGTVAGKSYYLMLSGALCFPLLGFWLVIAIFLGKSFRKAIHGDTVIC